MLRKPPDPPQGLTAVDPREWTRVWLRVISTTSVKSVGFACAAFADYETGAEIHPGIPLLMKVCGGRGDAPMGNKTVGEALELIRDWGLLWRYLEGSKNGRNGNSDVYRLTFPDDVLTRVPMLGPDWKPVDNSPDHLSPRQVIAGDHLSPEQVISPEHLSWRHATHTK